MKTGTVLPRAGTRPKKHKYKTKEVAMPVVRDERETPQQTEARRRAEWTWWQQRGAAMREVGR